MLALLLFDLGGLAMDHRIITGAPGWMKPAKFSISSAIYAATLGWVFGFLRAYRSQTRIAGLITAGILVVEVGIIHIQAARGVASHFNFRTPFDAAMYIVMGTAILVLWLASVWIAVLLFRTRFSNAALGWAIRLGMIITVIGAISGALMTRPTPSQQQAIVAHRLPPAIGAHTVGAPDGTPGLPVTGWSKQYGDLRIAHFLGLHGVQFVPLLYTFFMRRSRAAVRKVFVAAASYLCLTLVVLCQALRAQSILHPDGLTLAMLACWALATLLAWIIAERQKDTVSFPGAAEVI
jgi:hypothetical protein